MLVHTTQLNVEHLCAHLLQKLKFFKEMEEN
jgi:hypothetical protein